jgi:quercetin dioxygenase-like cupin family protein
MWCKSLRGLALGAALMGVGTAAQAAETQTLLSTDHTVVGEKLVYPASPAKVTAAIVTLAPGEATAWHTHGVPEVGYILDGEVTVDYGDKGTRVYRAGDAVMEAIDVAHKGTNTGTTPVRILVVYMGVEGKPTSIPAEDPRGK